MTVRYLDPSSAESYSQNPLSGPYVLLLAHVKA